VILDCIDHGDISIRTRALNLVSGMVNSDNLTEIVDKLVGQLLAAPTTKSLNAQDDQVLNDDPYASSEDDEDGEEALTQDHAQAEESLPIPDDYRTNVIRNILLMCSKDTYSNLNDFEWYINILVKLVKACPMMAEDSFENNLEDDVSHLIGNELRNVSVRVKAMRREATMAAQSLILMENRTTLFPQFTNGGQGVLVACAWLVGEFASDLTNSRGVLSSLLDVSTTKLPATALCTYLQAMLKVFSRIANDAGQSWTASRRTETTLLISRIIYFLEPLTQHPDLEVQELAVEYVELMRLTTESASSQALPEDGGLADAPLLITQVIPSLFTEFELNPIAPGAQYKIDAPSDLDLETAINPKLDEILNQADDDVQLVDQDEFEAIYYKKTEEVDIPETAAERLDLAVKSEAYSYQNTDPNLLARIKAERKEKNKDDPFYIDDSTSASSRLDNIIHNANGDDLDIDSIPIMELNLEGPSAAQAAAEQAQQIDIERRRKAASRKAFQIVADETLGDGISGSGANSVRSVSPNPSVLQKGKKGLLGVDSSHLAFSLTDDARPSTLDIEQREEEERALKEVERLRLEMQRASERIQARETTVVKKKKKRVKPADSSTQGSKATEGEAAGEETVVKKKKKKKKIVTPEGETEEGTESKPKKKKKRREVNLMEPRVEAE
jgi:AP-3 complex subunit delta-1